MVADSYLLKKKFPQRGTFPTEKSFLDYQRELTATTKGMAHEAKYRAALDIRSDVLYGKGGPLAFGTSPAQELISRIKPQLPGTYSTLGESRFANTIAGLPRTRGRGIRPTVDYWSTQGAAEVTEKGAGILSRLKGMMPGGAGALGKTYGEYYKDIPGGTAGKSIMKSSIVGAIALSLATMAATTFPKGREAIERTTGIEGTEALSPFRRVTAQAMWGGIEEKPQVVGMQTYMAMTKGYNDIAAGGFKELRRQTEESTAFLEKYGQENEIMTEAMTQFNDSMIKSIEIGEAVNNREMERKRIIETTKPVQDQLNKSLEVETLNMEANRRELKYKQQDLADVEGTIGKLTGARFQTGATIGGKQVSTQLGGMERMWELQKGMMEAQRAALVAPDPYAKYQGMVGAERLSGGAGRVGVARANLAHVSAATGTGFKDRAMVALQQLRAEEQLRSAQAGLDIETEHQRAQAADITGKAYEDASKKFQIAQLDMQLTYGNMEKQLGFFVAAHQDAANIEDGIPGSLELIKTKLESTWTKQTALNDSIGGLKTSIASNEDSIATFKENLRDLKENGVDYVKSSLIEYLELKNKSTDGPTSEFTPYWEEEQFKTS